VKAISAEAPEATSERYGTRIVHQDANARVVAFRLLPGQEVPAHRSGSTVILSVVSGRGTFRGEEGEQILGTGGAVAYAPGELHSVHASEEGLHFLAIIAPSPR